MEKKENKGIVKSKEIRLNIDYVNFISSVILEKMEDKRLIEEKYNNMVGLRWNNIERVNKRVNRKGFESNIKNMLKEKGVSYMEFRDKCKVIVDKEKEGNKNYLSIGV